MQVNPGGTNCSVLGLPGGAPYAAGVPQCFQFATPGGYEYAGFRAYQADGPAPTSNHCNLVGPWKLLRLNSGWGACSNNTVPGIYNGAQAPITTLALDCRTATICSVRPHSADRFIAYEVYNYPNNVGGTYLLDHPSVNQGELLRWSQRVYCRNFVTGTLQTYYERGPWTYAAAFEGQQPPEAASMCPSGFGLTRVITYQDTLPDAYKSSSYLDDYPDLGDAPHNSSTIADWNVPSFWTTDPVARTCFGSAFSDCQITINTNNPVPEVNLTNVTTQQVTTITATNPATNVGTAVQTLQPEPQTTTTVVTNPTTTAVTTTTVPGPPTTVPPEVPPSEPPPPPGPPDDGFAFGTCMDEQTVGISVGWSPASWIPALVRYIAAPILCSLLWLIVPADGFAALFDDLSRSLTDSELVGPFIGAVTSLQLSQCAPVTLPAVGSITGRSVDVGLCGNVVINSVWAMFFALGLLGLGKEAIDTVTQFRRNQAARSVQAQG
jgi:hypothetical protein